MRINQGLPWLFVIILLSGCTTRSISNSGYGSHVHYQGELTEFDVLGISLNEPISEETIQSSMNQGTAVKLKRGDTIILVQSGKQFPDDAMLQATEPYFKAIPLSGIPRRDQRRNNPDSDSSLNKAFRLAAARAGAESLIVYWGVLETSRKGHATKVVSWVPIAGNILPDERQTMRIRLKAIVMDVSSGHWEMLTPEVYSDQRTTAKINRRQVDQEQVDRLKTKAYRRLIEDLQTRFDR